MVDNWFELQVLGNIYLCTEKLFASVNEVYMYPWITDDYIRQQKQRDPVTLNQSPKEKEGAVTLVFND